eukprot:TRINITY_DN14599_c0_g1_i2.p1 TRINITY_DN14599_c0_g1~~TRINITY_DN14599_c0_g1_i2.p1  ORF type:complete len:218 (-),score=34.08 TRINITY_DN14599_c0_g1_i2:467-1120(-)
MTSDAAKRESRRAVQTSINATLAILPSEEFWPAIEVVRSVHDKACKKWQPHISILHPFVPEFEADAAADLIGAVLEQHSPFPLRFGPAQCRETGKSKDGRVYVSLSPDQASVHIIQSLQAQLLEVFPGCEAHAFPHLTLGQWPNKVEAKRACAELNASESLEGIEFVVEALQILHRRGESRAKVSRMVWLTGEDERQQGCPSESEMVQSLENDAVLK